MNEVTISAASPQGSSTIRVGRSHLTTPSGRGDSSFSRWPDGAGTRAREQHGLSSLRGGREARCAAFAGEMPGGAMPQRLS